MYIPLSKRVFLSFFSSKSELPFRDHIWHQNEIQLHWQQKFDFLGLCGLFSLVLLWFCSQVSNLKERGMDFLTIPDTYYENLHARLKNAPITVKEDLDVVSLSTEMS